MARRHGKNDRSGDIQPLLQAFLEDPDTTEVAKLKEELKKKLLCALSRRDDTIHILQDLVLEINTSCYRAQVAKTAGNSAAVVGGAVCVVGAVLIPFTLGLSAFALIPGGILGGGGAITTAGADLGHMAVRSGKKNTAEKQLQLELERLKEIETLGEKINQKMDDLVAKYPTLDPKKLRQVMAAIQGGVLSAKVAYKIYKVGDLGVDIGRAALRTYRIVQPFTGFLGPLLLAVDIIALPVDVVFMARAAHQVHRYRQGALISGTARKLQEVVEKLIESKYELQNHLDSLDSSSDTEDTSM